MHKKDLPHGNYRVGLIRYDTLSSELNRLLPFVEIAEKSHLISELEKKNAAEDK